MYYKCNGSDLKIFDSQGNPVSTLMEGFSLSETILVHINEGSKAATVYTNVKNVSEEFPYNPHTKTIKVNRIPCFMIPPCYVLGVINGEIYKSGLINFLNEAAPILNEGEEQI